METFQAWLVVLAFAALMFYLWYAHRQRFAARKAEMSDLAQSRGWRYQDKDTTLFQNWPGEPFHGGDHEAASHILRGTWKGRDFVAFDYSYQLRFLDKRAPIEGTRPTRRWGVVAMELPADLLPIQVEHEGLVERSGDTRFESDEFNRTFRVTGPDGQYVRAVITPKMMALMLDRGEVAWRIAGTHVLAWDKGSADGEDLERRLDLLAAVVDEIPNYVWADYGKPLPKRTTLRTTRVRLPALKVRRR